MRARFEVPRHIKPNQVAVVYSGTVGRVADAHRPEGQCASPAKQPSEPCANGVGEPSPWPREQPPSLLERPPFEPPTRQAAAEPYANGVREPPPKVAPGI